MTDFAAHACKKMGQNFGSTFFHEVMKGGVDLEHEQMISEVLEEIALKRECAPLLKQLINDSVVGKERKELIRVLRLKRDRLKVLNPLLFIHF